MKRLVYIAIISLISLCFAFAESKTLNLTANIEALAPTFNLVGSFSSDFSGTSNASALIGGNAILEFTGEETVVTAYFRVFQTTTARSNTTTDYSISAGPMKSQSNPSTNTASVAPVFVSQVPAVNGTRTVTVNVTNLEIQGLAGNGNFRLNYATTEGRPFLSSEYLAEAVFSWDVSDVPEDTYTADVVLTITGS